MRMKKAFALLFSVNQKIQIVDVKVIRHQSTAFFILHESLETTIARVVPYFQEVIAQNMKAGKRVLITAHGNSIRALVKYFDNMTKDEILEVNIPHRCSSGI